MKRAFIFFSDLINEEISSSDFPDQVELSQTVTGEQSVFQSVCTFLEKNGDIDSLTICTGYIPDWDPTDWTALFELSDKYGCGLYYFQKCQAKPPHEFRPYLATFDVKDLKMAVEQNYRPVFEDLSEAFSTFGFPVKSFLPGGNSN